MVSFESQYTGNLRTMVEHLSSSQKLITDAPLDNNGMGASFSPTDLVAGALGSCMATVMGIYGRKLGIDLDGLKWNTEKTMTSQPRRIDRIKIRFTWEQPVGSKQQLDELKEIALKCPVALSLDPKIQQEIQFDF
jgi:uncharacterized OsmC-like protein